MHWKSRFTVFFHEVPEQTSNDPSPSQVKGYAKTIEGLQEQLSSLSVATRTSRTRARASSVVPTSPIHVQAPSISPTHPLVAPGLEQPFDIQSKPASRSGRVQDVSRKDLLVSISHDIFWAYAYD